MVVNTIKNNRILKLVDKQIDKGQRIFILNFDYNDDIILQDLTSGVVTINQLLFNYLNNYKDIKHILFINEKDVIVKEFTTIDFTKNHIVPEGFGANSSTQLQNNTADNNTSSHLKIGNEIKNVIEKSKEDNQSFAVVINDLDWVASLYKNEDDNTNTFMKYIRSWKLNENGYFFVFAKNSDKIAQFDIDTNGNNFITLPKPDSNEIYLSMLRYIYKKEPRVNIVNHKDLIDVSVAFTSNKMFLSETNSILKKIIIRNKERNIMEVKKDDFNGTFESPIEEKVSFEQDVILNEKEKNQIKDIISNFLDKKNDNFKKGMILTGPPGTGKTHIARGLANDNNCYFMPLKLSDLKGEFIGQSAQMVRRIFQEARINSPTIMFIDEIDTVLTKRDGERDGDSFTKDIVNEFLVGIDGAGTQKDRIFILGATNRIFAVDSAIRSRLNDEIIIDKPDKINRRRIFQNHLKKINIDFFSWFDSFLENTVGFSGRDIKDFCIDIDKYAEINREAFYTVIKKFEKNRINKLKEDIPGVEVKEYGISLKNFNNIIGYEEEKKEIKESVEISLLTQAEERRRIEKLGIDSKGILLYGPPGNGKSLFAEATAGEYGLHYVKVISKDVFSNNIEVQLRNLEQIMDSCALISCITGDTSKGVLLFFDEFDSLASINSLSLQLRGSFLNYLEKYRKIPNLIIMAATNFYNELDEAIIRKGRFDIHVEISQPSEDNAVAIFDSLLKPNKEDLEYTLDQIEKWWDNIKTKFGENSKQLSFVDYKNLIDKVKSRSYINNRNFNQNGKIKLIFENGGI